MYSNTYVKIGEKAIQFTTHYFLKIFCVTKLHPKNVIIYHRFQILNNNNIQNTIQQRCTKTYKQRQVSNAQVLNSLKLYCKCAYKQVRFNFLFKINYDKTNKFVVNVFRIQSLQYPTKVTYFKFFFFSNNIFNTHNMFIIINSEMYISYLYLQTIIIILNTFHYTYLCLGYIDLFCFLHVKLI